MSRMRKVGLRSYHVTIGTGAFDLLAEILLSVAHAHRYAIISDDNVAPLYARRVEELIGAERCTTFVIPAGETQKTRESWAALTDQMLAAEFARDSVVIALGGGVIGDLAGFVAATYMRGIPYVQLPTSLLAMVDASVGGKTGVDTPSGKNLVGAFHRPAAVLADISVLSTLPASHLRAGMAEVIKHGVITDAAYFDEVLALLGGSEPLVARDEAMLAVVARSVEIKADVVRRDEREDGVRKTLNFGHTIGHAVELCSGFSLLHGEAIAIGMVYETMIAERLGVAERGTASRVRDAVRAAGLPDRRPDSISVDAVLDAARGDKKVRAGRVEYALPLRIGAMAAGDRGWSLPVSDAVVREVLA